MRLNQNKLSLLLFSKTILSADSPFGTVALTFALEDFPHASNCASGHMLNNFHAGRTKQFSCFACLPVPAVLPPLFHEATTHCAGRQTLTCVATETSACQPVAMCRVQAALLAAASMPGPRPPEVGRGTVGIAVS